MSATPGGRSRRLEYVWFVMRFVIDRVLCSSRMFWISGSENGSSPRNVSLLQLVLAPAAAPQPAVVAVGVGAAQASGGVVPAGPGGYCSGVSAEIRQFLRFIS